MEIPVNRHSLTKIIATLGPASAEEGMVKQLILAGVSVFRINFSHGGFEDFERMLRLVRQVAASLNRPIGVMGDLPGPKVRLGKVVGEGVKLTAGQEVRFVKEPVVTGAGEPLIFSTTCPEVLDEIQPNEPILLDDGAVRLRCSETSGNGQGTVVTAEVTAGGTVTSSKGMNLPQTALTLPALTPYDFACLEFLVKKEFDFVSLSFVRRGDDVRQLKEHLRKLGARPNPSGTVGSGENAFGSYGAKSFIPVVSKIEKPQAIYDLEDIVHETDVIMVARGDLGVEMDLAQVPVIQKRIIAECNNQGKPAIVATQMLQSMIEKPSATRAEVSDVANAILDGADAVMLSGETAVGKYPLEAVRTLRQVGLYTHQHRRDHAATRPSLPAKPRASKYRTAALARGVAAVLQDLDAPLVAIWSSHGGGASYLSQLRLPLPVVAFSAEQAALRRMSIMYGIWPVYQALPELTATFIRQVDELLLEQNWAVAGDPIVIVLGQPFGRPGLTNDLRIHYVGDRVDTTPMN